MAIRAHFQGDGSQFLTGVPARDLDDTEFDALPAETQQAVLLARDSAGHLLYRVTDKAAALEAAGRAEPAPVLADPETEARRTRRKGGE